jgi:hypothetical protein
MTNDQLRTLQKAVNDTRLSWRAKGILLACAFSGAEESFSKTWILEHGKEGRDAITSAMKELRVLEYIEEVLIKEGATGQITGRRFAVKTQEQQFDF